MHQLVRAGEPESAPPVHLRVGTLVAGGRYRIVQRLATGSMGEVHLVEHTELGRPMAMKVLLPSLAQTPQFVQRFRIEAETVSRLAHPNIVAITELGAMDDGALFMVMEYLEGVTLAQLFRERGALPITRVLALGAQIARALAAAHEQNVVHRDVKPENVMLVRKEGRELAKVLDFGVARVETHDGSLGQTRAGTVLGTPRYMSPEQVQAKQPIDARSDVYSLGLVLHEALCGVPVFKGKSHAIVMWQQLKDEPAPLSESVPRELGALVMQMLEKDPARRPQRMSIVVERLEALTRQFPPYVPDRVASIDALPLVFANVEEARTVLREDAGLVSEAVAHDAGTTAPDAETGPTRVPTSEFQRSRTELELRLDETLLEQAFNDRTLTPAPIDSRPPLGPNDRTRTPVPNGMLPAQLAPNDRTRTPVPSSSRSPPAQLTSNDRTRTPVPSSSRSPPQLASNDRTQLTSRARPEARVDRTLTPTPIDSSRTMPELVAVPSPLRAGTIFFGVVALLLLGVIGVVGWLQYRASTTPRLVPVVLDSSPPGAQVREAGVLLGTTPLIIERSARSLSTLDFSREGKAVRRTVAVREPSTNVEVDLR